MPLVMESDCPATVRTALAVAYRDENTRLYGAEHTDEI